PTSKTQFDFYKTLGMPAPKELMLFPIYIEDHLVAIFYGDGGSTGEIRGETADYVRLFRIFPQAVSLIMTKDSMRAVGYSFTAEKAETELASTGNDTGA